MRTLYKGAHRSPATEWLDVDRYSGERVPMDPPLALI